MIVLVVQDEADGPLADLRGVACCSAHSSKFSKSGASDKPGAVHEALCDPARLVDLLASPSEPDDWFAGVHQVLTANLDSPDLNAACQAGIRTLLNHATRKDFNQRELTQGLQKVHYGLLDRDLVIQLIRLRANDPELRFLPIADWIEQVSARDPNEALTLLETLVSATSEDSPSYHTGRSGLTSALFAILREADDAEDEDLIARVIAVQDKLVLHNLVDIDELEEAAGRA